MKLVKQFFNIFMTLSNDQLIEFIMDLPITDDNKYLIIFSKAVCSFKNNHPIICKIPFINWMVFKRYNRRLTNEKT